MGKKKISGQKPAVVPAAIPSWWDQYFNPIFYSIIAVAGSIYSILNFNYRTGILNDDALYVITSLDFWNTKAAHPLLQIKPDYPFPGLPMIMAPFAKLFNPHLYVLEWMAVIAMLLSGWLLGIWLKRFFSSGETLAIVALYLFNPLVVRFSGIVMPSPYFNLAVIASFFLMHECLLRPTLMKTLALGFISGWGAMVRPEGVLLPFSLVVVLLFSKKDRHLLRTTLIPLVMWAVFFLAWFQSRRVSETEYGGDLVALRVFWAQHFLQGMIFPYRWFQTIVLSTWRFSRFISVAFLAKFIAVFFVLYTVGVLVGFWRLWQARPAPRRLLTGIGLFYISLFLIHVFWHVTEDRYFLVLLPFSLIFLTGAANRRRWGQALVVFFLIFNGYEISRKIDRAYLSYNPMHAPPWESLEWIKNNTKPKTKIISNVATTIDLYTGRPTSVLLNAISAEMLQYLLATRGFEYIVLRDGIAVTPGVGETGDVNVGWNRYRRWVKNHPDRFPLAFQDPTGTAAVYRVSADPDFIKAYRDFIAASQYGKNGQYDLAFQKLKSSIASDDGLGCSNNYLGALYFMKGKPDLAEKSFLKAFKVHADAPNALFNLATLYNSQGNKEKAMEFFQKGMAVNRENGDEPEIKQRAAEIIRGWEKNESALMIGFPPPGFYEDLNS